MTESFLKGPLAGRLFRFALPVAFTIICEQLVNGTDVFVLGKFVGPAAMAAVGNDVPVISLLISLLVGLSLGTNVTLAQAVGARKEAAARKILHTSLLFSVLIGLVFAGIGEIIVRPLLALLAVPPQVLAEAELYLRIFLLALLFFRCITLKLLSSGLWATAGRHSMRCSSRQRPMPCWTWRQAFWVWAWLVSSGRRSLPMPSMRLSSLDAHQTLGNPAFTA